MPELDFQKCEPGWGYDCKTGSFIPINYVGNLRTTLADKTLYFYYEQNPFNFNLFIDYEDIARWIINENPNAYKFMDFYFANYQICEFAFNVWYFTRIITAEESDNYPPEATHFVQK
uniref:Uncharacterized protein n=1 Tax=Panagrolaimus sp. JU765 TaxID=591449 RepID=A0AC34R6D4_9BILA